MCLGARGRQYFRYTKSPLVNNPLREIWESPRVNKNLTSVGFEPTTSGLDLPMLYQLSYEASTGADIYTVAPRYNEVPWYRKNVCYSGVFVIVKTPL